MSFCMVVCAWHWDSNSGNLLLLVGGLRFWMYDVALEPLSFRPREIYVFFLFYFVKNCYCYIIFLGLCTHQLIKDPWLYSYVQAHCSCIFIYYTDKQACMHLHIPIAPTCPPYLPTHLPVYLSLYLHTQSPPTCPLAHLLA